MNTIISQAMATQMPVIATKHSGLPEQVTHGENGYLVNESDPQDLAEKMKLIAEHPETWARMGQSGRQHAFKTYDARKLIDEQIGYYQAAISEG